MLKASCCYIDSFSIDPFQSELSDRPVWYGIIVPHPFFKVPEFHSTSTPQHPLSCHPEGSSNRLCGLGTLCASPTLLQLISKNAWWLIQVINICYLYKRNVGSLSHKDTFENCKKKTEINGIKQQIIKTCICETFTIFQQQINNREWKILSLLAWKPLINFVNTIYLSGPNSSILPSSTL